MRNYKQHNARIHYTEVGAGCLVDNKLWYCAAGFNSLLVYDIENNKLEWKNCFPGEEFWKPFLYRNCIKWNDKLVFAPYNGKGFAIVDMSTNEISQIPLADYDNYSSKIYNIAASGDYVIAFGEQIPKVFFLNMKTETITEDNSLHDELSKMGHDNISYYFARNSVNDENGKLYLVSTKANVLVEYDLKNRIYELHKLGGDKSGTYVNLLKKEKEIFLIPGFESKFATYNLDTGELKEIGEENKVNEAYYPAFIIDDVVKVFPRKGNCIAEWHISDDTIIFDSNLKKYEVSEMNFHSNRNIPKFFFVSENDRYIVWFSSLNRKLYVYDKETKKEKSDELLIDSTIRQQVYKYMSEIAGIWTENAFYNLNDLILPEA